MSKETLNAKQLAQEIAEAISWKDEEFFTAMELANFLKVSEGYVRQHTELFPSIRIGGNVRYPKSRIVKHFVE